MFQLSETFTCASLPLAGLLKESGLIWGSERTGVTSLRLPSALTPHAHAVQAGIGEREKTRRYRGPLSPPVLLDNSRLAFVSFLSEEEGAVDLWVAYYAAHWAAAPHEL